MGEMVLYPAFFPDGGVFFHADVRDVGWNQSVNARGVRKVNTFSDILKRSCWVKQTRLHQTDIAGPGIVLSLLIITTFHIVNFCLVITLNVPSGAFSNVLLRIWSFSVRQNYFFDSSFSLNHHCYE